jgi:hypothetical protein
LSLTDLLCFINISLKFLVIENEYTTNAHFFFFASIDILSGLSSSIASTNELYLGKSPVFPFSIKYPNTERPTNPKNIKSIAKKPNE